MKRLAILVLVSLLAGLGTAAAAPMVTPPAGWKGGPDAHLAEVTGQIGHFGDLHGTVDAEQYSPAPGIVLDVARITAQTTAPDVAAGAELDALKNGKAVIRAKDDPTLADLQQRVSTLREQWHEMQGRFTPAYLAFDADAKALQARLANLEEQLQAQIAASQRTAAAEAQEEFASAQAAAERLRQDVAANQKQAQEFATHLND